MHTAGLRFLVLVVAVFLISSVAPLQAQGTFSHGTVVALQGTPHLWFADEQGVLHWGGDTRALAGKHIAWSNRVEVSLDRLRTLPVGDPWLSAGLLKDGDPIYLVKWESDWPQPQLLHIQSIGDVELFGINGSNYGNFVIDRPAWEQRFGISAAGLQRGTLATTTVPGTTRENPLPLNTGADFSNGWRITVLSATPNANSQVAGENRFNDPPKAGHQFFMARVAVTRIGAGSESFWLEGTLRTVGGSAVAYADHSNSCGVVPDELPETQEVFSGGTIVGNLCWEIRSADAGSLLMYYEPDGPFGTDTRSQRRFFSLR